MPRRLLITHHAARRIRERWTYYGPVLSLWRAARPMPPAQRGQLTDWCPAHADDLRARSEARTVYWYQRGASLWRVFVTAPVRPGLFALLTYFETPCRAGVPLPRQRPPSNPAPASGEGLTPVDR